jgi:VCBS repeat-containing protein
MLSNDYNYVAGLKNGSTEGQLASSYTNWVNAEVKANAEYIASIAFNGGMSLEAAKAIQSALATGNFSVTDLFLTAQTKTGAIVADIAGTPKPVLHVNGVDMDLAQFFDKTHTETVQWDAGNGKSAVTQVREFLDKWNGGTAEAGWDKPVVVHVNEGPTASAQSINVAENQSGANPTIDLLGTAHDTDGGSLAIVAGSIVIDTGTGSLPSWIKLDGNSLVIDQNSPDLDHLNIGDQESVTVTYKVTDGQGGEVATSVTIKLNGTNDLPTVEAIKAEATEGSGNLPVNLLAGASDVDDATAALHVVDGSLAVHGGGALPEWASLDGNGNLVINQNDAAFDHLGAGDPASFVFDFQVADGHGGMVPNSVTINMTGTNDAPTVVGPLHIAGVETTSVYNASHQITNTGADNIEIDLLGGAKDVDDGASLSITDLDTLPAWASLKDGHILVINQNHADFNALTAGQKMDALTLNFKVSDGLGGEVPNTVTIDMTGTADQYHDGHFTADASAHFTASQGNLNNQSLTFSLPNDGGFDFNLSGQLVVTGHGLDGNEKSTISDFASNDGNFQINVGKVGNDMILTASAGLSDTALDPDHKVDFNISWNGQTEPTDSVDVSMHIIGDYWHIA